MKHILIVDDNASCLVLARNILQDEFHVNVVTSGEQAIKFLTRNQPDLVILDLNMLGMSGEETLQRMREIPGFTGKVMLLSAQTAEAAKLLCSRLHADSFLVKPYQAKDLKSLVIQLLEDK